MADTNDTLKKTQQIAAEAVGQLRGAAPTLKSSIEDWFAQAESSISKNPLLAVTLAGAVGFAIATVNSGAAGRAESGSFGFGCCGGGTKARGCCRAGADSAIRFGEGTSFGSLSSGAGVQIICGGRSVSCRPATSCWRERRRARGVRSSRGCSAGEIGGGMSLRLYQMRRS